MHRPAKSLLDAAQTEITDKQARLQELEQLQGEAIPELEGSITRIEESRKELRSEINAKQKSLQEWTAVKQLHEERLKNTQRREQLDQQRPAMEALQESLSKLEQYKSKWGDSLVKMDVLEKELSRLEQELNDMRTSWRAAKVQEESAAQAFEVAKSNKSRAESNAERMQHFEIQASWLKLEDQRKAAMQKTLVTDAQLKEIATRLQAISEEEQKLKEELSASKTQLKQSDDYQEIQTWKMDWKGEKKALDVQTSEVASKKELLEKSQAENQPVGATSNDPQQWLESRQAKLRTLQKDEAKLTREVERLKQHEHLSELAGSLEDGEPCPLCGSVHHPASFEQEELDGHAEQELLEKREEVKSEEKKISVLEQQIKQWAEQTEALARLEQACNQAMHALRDKEKNYSYAGLLRFEDLDKLEGLIANRKALQSKVDDQEQQLEKLSEGKNKALQEQTSHKEQQQAENQALAKIEGQQVTLEQDNLPQEIAAIKNLAYISTELEQLRSQSLNVDAELERSQKNLEEARSTYQKLEVQGGEKKQLLEQKQGQLTRLKEDAESQLLGEKDSLADVRAFLSNQDSLLARKSEWERFREEDALIKSRLQELDQKLNGQVFEEQKSKDLEAELEKLVEHQDVLTQQQAEIKLKLEQHQQNAKRKKELSEALSLLTQRAEGLQTITRMMVGKGFVNYVSSVYLREIVAAANVRFAKLTHQSLQLEIDDKNHFQIRDYLNGGHLRSAKTLSGGQTFQAALCLALALAERIQTESGADQQFFFLDEGFGSLDEDSLQTVFETLKALRKENRVVGIISHVTALQQEIPAHVMVSRHEEKGSQLEVRV